MLSILGFIPFGDATFLRIIEGVSEGRMKFLTDYDVNAAVSTIGATLGAISNAGEFIATFPNVTIPGAWAKFLKVSGWVSFAITGLDIVSEIRSDEAYITEITRRIYGANITSIQYGVAVEKYIIYNGVVREALDRGIITYTTNAGLLRDYSVDAIGLANLEEEMGTDYELIDLLFGG